MLDDDDSRVIAELERRIHLSDPDFAARMAGTSRDLPFPVVGVLFAALFVLVPPVTLLFGWPGLVVVIDVFLAGLVIVLVRRHRRR